MRVPAQLGAIVCVVAVLGLATPASAEMSNTFITEMPGPLDSVNIDVLIWNEDPWIIDEVWFDLPDTSLGGEPLIIDGDIFGITGDPVGHSSAVAGGVPLGNTFHISFTDFDPGEHFGFGWDPDIPSDASYGAIVGELAGTIVTFLASGHMHSGILEPFVNAQGVEGLRAVAGAGKVPEPGTLTIFALGAATMLGLGWRRRKRSA